MFDFLACTNSWILPTNIWLDWGQAFVLGTTLPWLCCSEAILPQVWKYALGHFPFGIAMCIQALMSWFMSWYVVSIYPHTFTSSWCNLYYKVHQYLLQKNNPITWCCQPHASRLGWWSLTCKPHPFSSKFFDGLVRDPGTDQDVKHNPLFRNKFVPRWSEGQRYINGR